MEALESAPGSKTLLHNVARTAGTLLTRHGVKWHRAQEDRDIIVIAAIRDNSTLNNLAHGLRRDVGGLELRFDPRALVEESAAALYDEDANHLLLSTNEIETGAISDYFAHEIVHAQNFHALTRGIDNLFMGWISSGESSPPFHPTYTHLFSIDELQAYARQARVNIRDLHRGHGDIEGTNEMLEAGRKLAIAANTAATESAALIASIAADGSKSPDILEMRGLNEEPSPVIGFAAAQGRVYFKPEPLPSRIANPPSALRAVAETREFQLDLVFPTELAPTSFNEALAAFLKRTRRLADRSQALATGFSELKSMVAAGAFTTALEESRVLQELARRNP